MVISEANPVLADLELQQGDLYLAYKYQKRVL